jgi:hypothetical protein
MPDVCRPSFVEAIAEVGQGKVSLSLLFPLFLSRFVEHTPTHSHADRIVDDGHQQHANRFHRTLLQVCKMATHSGFLGCETEADEMMIGSCR